jgi:hypothetical protein
MGDVHGPEKVNNTCVKTVHMGTMNTFSLLLVFLYTLHVT